MLRNASPTTTPSDQDEWHVDGFLDEFTRIHEDMPDQSYAFILGSGASRSSGIPTGADLVDLWLKELYRCDPQSRFITIEEWATNDRLHIPNFEYDQRAKYYSDIYKLRFRRNPGSGPSYLESLMEHAEPSFGYTVLANILTKTRHQVVVTTNFDNLVADALFIHADTHPLICGHELLAHYVHLRQRRPLVAKVHRDLFYEPQNTRQELSQLPESWQSALKRLFTHYTPLVIGYGGNDGTLMGFLQDLEEDCVPGGIFWFYVGHDKPKAQILSVIRKQRGVFISIPGFDELMLMLNERLGFNFLRLKELHSRAAQRYERYMRQIQTMSENMQFIETNSDNPCHNQISIAFANIIDQMDPEELDKQWWIWEYRARREVDEKPQEAMFRRGLEFCKDSARLHSHFANFLTDVCKKYDEAYEHHKIAYSIDQNDHTVVANYAAFCAYIRKDKKTAGILFRNAIGAHSTNDELLYKYALFLAREEHCDSHEVDHYFQRAVQAGPVNCFVLANYGWWLLKNGRYPDALEFVTQALTYSSSNMQQLKAELLLYRAILLRIRGEDDTKMLYNISKLLRVDFARVEWPLDAILPAASTKLSSADRALYKALVRAILNPEEIGELQNHARWRELNGSLQNSTMVDDAKVVAHAAPLQMA